MKGMIDGRRLKRAWDGNELGELLLGQPPYDYEPDAAMDAYFTRLRQVTDFLRCRTASERQRPLASAVEKLEASEEGWAGAAALLLKRSFGSSLQDDPPNVNMPE